MNIKELKKSIAFKGMDENDIEQCIKSLNTNEHYKPFWIGAKRQRNN